MRYGTQEYTQQPEFLRSGKYTNFTTTVSATGITADSEGKKYALAGSLIDEAGKVIKITSGALSAAPVGILFRTVNVTDGPQPAALMVEGYITIERLPVDITAVLDAVKTALPKITFM